jgi:hypothetical protein
MMFRSPLVVVLSGCAFFAVPSIGHTQSSAIETLRNLYVNCVESAFAFSRVDEFALSGNLAAAIELSFADCRAEENALYTTTASLMLGISADQAMLRSRAAIDRLKVNVKAKIAKDFSALAPAKK